MSTNPCSRSAFRATRSGRRHRLSGVALLATLVVHGWGCGADPSRDAQSHVNVMVAQRLGEAVAQHVDTGDVVLLHLSSNPGESDRWMKGLREGLGKAFTVVELGPAQLPAEAMAGMGGNPSLQYALKQYPDVRAIITTRPVGAHERPVFPPHHPPLFALKWSYLPDSIHLFESGHLAAGIFARPDGDPTADASLTAEASFERNYVLATPENLRALVSEY